MATFVRTRSLSKLKAKIATILLTKSAKQLQYDRQHGYCCWCGQGMTLNEATWEHIIPKSLGGSDESANLALAHEPCNKLRNADVTKKPHDNVIFDFMREVLEKNGAYRAAHFPVSQVYDDVFWRQQE